MGDVTSILVRRLPVDAGKCPSVFKSDVMQSLCKYNRGFIFYPKPPFPTSTPPPTENDSEQPLHRHPWWLNLSERRGFVNGREALAMERRLILGEHLQINTCI